MSNTITVTNKPSFGKFERECVCCGTHYTRYHMYLCLLCDVECDTEIIEVWNA